MVFSLGYLVSVIYAQIDEKLLSSCREKKILYWYIAINIIITSVFFVQVNAFLSGRYLIPLALTLLCFVPFGLSSLYHRWKARTKTWTIHNVLFWFVVFSMLVMTIGSLHRFGPSKGYIYKSAAWIRKNTPETATVYTNHEVLAFLTDRQFAEYHCGVAIKDQQVEEKHVPFSFFAIQGLTMDVSKKTTCSVEDNISQKLWEGYDYVILVVSKDNNELIDQFEGVAHVQPIKVFSDNPRRGDQSYIFKLK